MQDNKTHLLNSTILHNTQSNAFSALVHMLLVEHQWTIIRNEVTEHAGEDSTIITCRNFREIVNIHHYNTIIPSHGQSNNRDNSPFNCLGVSEVHPTNFHSLTSISPPFLALYSSFTYSNNPSNLTLSVPPSES